MSAPPTLRPLGVGELLDAAIYVYRKSLVTLIGIAMVMAVPIMLIQFAAAFLDPPLNLYLRGAFSPLPPDVFRDPFILFGMGLFYYISGPALSGLISPIAIVFEVGALACAASEARMGHRVSIGGAYRRALHRWTSLLGSAILVQLSVVVASSFLIVLLYAFAASSRGAMLLSFAALLGFIPASMPIVYFAVRWSLTTPAIVLENLGALKGMGRSWRLTKGSLRRTFAIFFGAGLLTHFLTYAVFAGVQYAASLLPDSQVLGIGVTSAGSFVVGTVIQPLAYVAITLLYYDLRVRHEGYDLQLALDQLKQTAPAVSTRTPA